MPRYAANTDVSSERSKAEIERTLQRYGAEEFVYGVTTKSAMIGFRLEGRMIRIVLQLPDKASREFTHTPGRGLPRTQDQVQTAWEQACRQRWRALALVVKAKLEAIDAGISDLESEFLANIYLPNGTTVGEWMKPQIERVYELGEMPSLLPMLPGRSSD